MEVSGFGGLGAGVDPHDGVGRPAGQVKFGEQSLSSFYFNEENLAGPDDAPRSDTHKFHQAVVVGESILSYEVVAYEIKVNLIPV